MVGIKRVGKLRGLDSVFLFFFFFQWKKSFLLVKFKKFREKCDKFSSVVILIIALFYVNRL